MTMVTCSECATLISDKAAACASCGAPVPKQRRLGKAIALTVFGLFMAVLIIGSLQKPSPESIKHDSDRAAIANCWKDQARKSFEPALARYVAKMCETMEADFLSKYNENP